MNASEFSKRVLAGERLCVVEYRTLKPVDRSWRDPATGRVLDFSNLRHGIESGVDQITVIERLPDGVKAADAKVSLKKGDKCVLHLRTLAETKGELTCTGELEPLTA